MILRKPYAFLIKHFKIIHVVLLLLNAIIIYQVTALVSFINLYIQNGYSASADVPTISIEFFIPVIGIFIITILIISLFKNKQKPTTDYSLTLVYYTVLTIMCILSKTVFTQLVENTVNITTARIYHDVAIIVFIPQFLCSILYLIRALGLNVRQYQFEKDIRELAQESDNEEIEVSINFDTYKQKRNIRRVLYELWYYYKENKLFISVILLAVLGGFIFYLTGLNKSFITNYKQTDTVIYKNKGIVFNFEQPVITNVDCGGNIIEEDKSYVVLEVYIKETSNIAKNFKFSELKLFDKTDYTYINPSKDISSKFIDFGKPFTNYTYKKPPENGTSMIIDKDTGRSYILAYEIDKDSVKHDFEARIQQGYEVYRGIYYPKAIVVNLDPLILSETTSISSQDMSTNPVIDLSPTILKNTKIEIKSYEIKDAIDYKFCKVDSLTGEKNCELMDEVTNTEFFSTETLMKLTGKITIDPKSPFGKANNTTKTFINSFMTVEYEVGGQKYTVKLKDYTPDNLTGAYVVRVPKKIKNATSIKLITTIRFQKYELTLLASKEKNK